MRDPLRFLLVAVAAILALSGMKAYTQGNSAPNVQPNPYRTIKNWAKLPEGRMWGQTSAIDVDSHDHIWVADRCGGTSCAGTTLNPIL